MITEAMIENFKAAWHRADAKGDTGNRVRAGLQAALSQVIEPGDWVDHRTRDLDPREVHAVGLDWIEIILLDPDHPLRVPKDNYTVNRKGDQS